jgi:hypothetical protein
MFIYNYIYVVYGCIQYTHSASHWENCPLWDPLWHPWVRSFPGWFPTGRHLQSEKTLMGSSWTGAGKDVVHDYPWLSMLNPMIIHYHPLPVLSTCINYCQQLINYYQQFINYYQMDDFPIRYYYHYYQKKSLLGGWDDFPIRYLSPSSPKPGWTSQRIFCRWFTWPTSWACWSETWHWRRGRR